ncbi:MAG TPA: radical SAM protein, partial [Rectinemataceae bacterium]|nr:radical SAM protein [Rectinemataceae bacterium]
METPRECLVMAKPAGPLCNLRCSYCYYVGKTELLGGDSSGGASSGGTAGEAEAGAAARGAGAEAGPMDLGLLERYIAQRFAASGGPVTHFEWHGGESTLLGLEYFETIVRLQKRHRPSGRRVSNGLQTNGMLIDAAWADFLAREGFSVGLSLDGPAEMHDRYRRRVDGSPTQARVLEAFALLKERRVFTNLLCVLSAANVGEPDRVYDFFKGIGATYLQFLPLVVRSGASGGEAPEVGMAGAGAAMAAVSEATAPAEAIGAFLCRVFDRWIAEDVG